MTHAQFVEAQKSGQTIIVNRHKALIILTEGLLPKRYTYAHIFWSWVWGLSILGFIVGAFFTMGISLLGLVFVSPMISRAVKASASEFVVDYAVENAEFYRFASDNEIITVK